MKVNEKERRYTCFTSVSETPIGSLVYFMSYAQCSFVGWVLSHESQTHFGAFKILLAPSEVIIYSARTSHSVPVYYVYLVFLSLLWGGEGGGVCTFKK